MSESESETGRLPKTKKKSWWFERIILGTIIFWVLGVGGIAWYMRRSLEQTVASMQARTKESKRPSSRLQFSKPRFIGATTDAPALLLDFLAPSPQIGSGQENLTDLGLLQRELIRQSFLLTAREDFGVPTRDAVLGEELPWLDAVGIDGMLISSTLVSQRILQITVLTRSNQRSVAEYLLRAPDHDTIPHLTSRLESMSREKFPEVLKRLGFVTRKAEQVAPAEIPVDIAERSQKLSCLSQFAVVRALHGRRRAAGESPETLTALARAYANLGLLTETHWHPAHKVFKARALLYAERAVNKYPGANSSYTRAFVRALIGLHRDALEDLQAAAALLSPDPSTTGKPEWAETVEAFCKFDPQRLAAESVGPQRPLACYLQLLFAESTQSPVLRRQAAQAVLEADPACVRALDIVTECAVLENARELITSAPQLFGKSLYVEMRSIPDLPENIQELLANPPEDPFGEMSHRVKLMQALQGFEMLEQESGEPSLAVVGQLLREMSFIQVRREMSARRELLFEDTNERLQQLQPLLEKHLFRSLVNFNPTKDPGGFWAYRELDQQTMAAHIESTEEPVIFATQYPPMIDKSLAHADRVFLDLLFKTRREKTDVGKRQAARDLRDVSPHAPATIAASIEHDWDYGAAHAAKWEQTFADNAQVQGALGKRYLTLKQFGDAERCLKRQLAVLPSQDSYRQLAVLYKMQRNDAEWVSLLEQSLSSPAIGLEHVRCRVDLASHYQRVGDVPAAQVHADLAAESGADWALLCAADIHEKLQDWNGAEERLKQASDRFAEKSVDWYFWCRRTGHGDLEEARQRAEKVVPLLESHSYTRQKFQAALFHDLEGRPEKALEILKAAAKQSDDPYVKLHAALIADELGQAGERDELLADTIQTTEFAKHSAGELARNFRDAVVGKKNKAFDPKINEWRLRKTSAGEPTDWHYLIGQFLVLRDRIDEGIPYLQQAAISSRGDIPGATLAGVALARRGVKRGTLLAAEIDPQTDRILELARQGTEELKNRLFGRAQETVAQGLAIDPDSIDMLYLRGRIALEQESFEGIDADLTRCLERYPDVPELLRIRACGRLGAGNLPGATADFEKLAAFDADDESLYILLADCHERAGAWDKAESMMRQLSEREPKNSLKWYLWCRRTGRGDLKSAQALGEKDLNLIAATRTSDCQLQVASYFSLEHKPKAALPIFLEEFKRDRLLSQAMLVVLIERATGTKNSPDTDFGYLFELACAREIGELIGGIYDSLVATPPCPLDPRVVEWLVRRTEPGQPTDWHYVFGRLYQSLNQPQEAEQFFKLAAASPYHTRPSCILAGAELVRLGIEQDPRRATELDAESARVLAGLRPAYGELGRKEYDQVRQRVDEALRTHPDSIDALYLAGQMAFATDQFEQARDHWTRFLERVPNSTEVICLRGRAYEALGGYSTAIEEYERAIQLDEHSYIPYNNLAYLYGASEDPKVRDGAKSVQYGRMAKDRATRGAGHWQANNALAVGFAESGNFPEAVRHAQLALDQARAYPSLDWEIISKERLALFEAGIPYRRPPRRPKP